MKLKVLHCVCSDIPLFVCDENMEHWSAYCPKCFRDTKEYKSPYYAVKAWNVMQEGLRSPYSAVFYDEKKKNERRKVE